MKKYYIKYDILYYLIHYTILYIILYYIKYHIKLDFTYIYNAGIFHDFSLYILDIPILPDYIPISRLPQNLPEDRAGSGQRPRRIHGAIDGKCRWETNSYGIEYMVWLIYITIANIFLIYHILYTICYIEYIANIWCIYI